MANARGRFRIGDTHIPATFQSFERENGFDQHLFVRNHRKACEYERN
jgi:hypothetical protein